MHYLRYLGVQGAGYALDMGSFLLLTALGLHPLASNIFGKVVSAAFAFVAHRTFTFGNATGAQGQRSDMLRQALRYGGLVLFNIPLSSGVLALMLALVPLPQAANKFLADVSCIAITYWLTRRFVFTKTVSGSTAS